MVQCAGFQDIGLFSFGYCESCGGRTVRRVRTALGVAVLQEAQRVCLELTFAVKQLLDGDAAQSHPSGLGVHNLMRVPGGAVLMVWPKERRKGFVGMLA